MKLESKYLLLKIQGMVTLLCLLAVAYWSAFQKDALLFFLFILVIFVVQIVIFFRFWIPTSMEYKKTKGGIKIEKIWKG